MDVPLYMETKETFFCLHGCGFEDNLRGRVERFASRVNGNGDGLVRLSGICRKCRGVYREIFLYSLVKFLDQDDLVKILREKIN